MLRGRPARPEERFDRGALDFCQARGIPVRLVVLFDDEGANPLDEVTLFEATVDEIQLHAEALREREMSAALQLLERHAQHRGGALLERRERLRRPLRVARTLFRSERGDDGG